MSEYVFSSPDETSPEELRDRLQEPFVKLMLEAHFKEYLMTGILRQYDIAVQAEHAPYNDEIIEDMLHMPEHFNPDWISKSQSRRFSILPIVLEARAAEAPLLVGKAPDLDWEEAEELGDYESYFLEKVNSQTGEYIYLSRSDVGAFRQRQDSEPQYLPHSSDYTADQVQIVKRHYQDQVQAGIIYRGQCEIPKAD